LQLHTCKLCKFHSDSYASIFLHIKQNHQVADVESLLNDTTPSAVERNSSSEDVVETNPVSSNKR
jgi:hypothetical protein